MTLDRPAPSVGELVDCYRALPGVEPKKRDGPRIAGLVKLFGAVNVKTMLEVRGARIGQARIDPLALLATILARGDMNTFPVPNAESTCRRLHELRRQGEAAGRSERTMAEFAALRKKFSLDRVATMPVPAAIRGKLPQSAADYSEPGGPARENSGKAARRSGMAHIGSLLSLMPLDAERSCG